MARNSFEHISGEYYDAGDANIYCEITGNKDKPVLLLLHGGFGTIEDFNTILPWLKDNYYVIGVDSRGHGKSALGSQKLTYQRLQQDIEGLLEHLNIKKLNIIGFSDGGIVAYRLAAFSSLIIEKLITIGSRWQISDALLTKDIFLKITPESWKAKFPQTYITYQKLNPLPDFDKLVTSVIAMWLDDSPAGYPNEQLINFKGSLLIVRGDADHLITRKSVTELAGLQKNAMLLNIPFAGHAAFTDQPEIFKMVTHRFLIESGAP